MVGLSAAHKEGEVRMLLDKISFLLDRRPLNGCPEIYVALTCTQGSASIRVPPTNPRWQHFDEASLPDKNIRFPWQTETKGFMSYQDFSKMAQNGI
jgi:hypothetical protein